MRVEIAKGKESLPFHWPFFLSVDSNPRDRVQSGPVNSLRFFGVVMVLLVPWICATYAVCSIQEGHGRSARSSPVYPFL